LIVNRGGVMNYEWVQGDIVVWKVIKNTKSWFSRLLAWAFPKIGQGGTVCKPSFSHSAVLSEKYGYVYESTWPKTRHAPIPYKDYVNYELEVYRISGITHAQRITILRTCQENLGKWYDVLEILSFGLINLRKYDACSEYVRRAYRAAGITLGKKKDYLVSPNEIVYETSLIFMVGKISL